MGILRAATGRRRRVSAMLAGAALAAALSAAASPLRAQAPAAAGDAYARERLAFEVADSDGDGLIDEAELTRDAAVGFSTLDVDRDRRLTRAELGEYDPKLFDRVDADRDGALDFEEMLAGARRELEEAK